MILYTDATDVTDLHRKGLEKSFYSLFICVIRVQKI